MTIYDEYYWLFNSDCHKQKFKKTCSLGLEADLLRAMRQTAVGALKFGKTQKKQDLYKRSAQVATKSYRDEIQTILSKRDAEELIQGALEYSPELFFDRFWFYLDWDAPTQKNGKNYSKECHRNVSARENIVWRTNLPFWFVCKYENLEKLSKAIPLFWQREVKLSSDKNGKILPGHAEYLLKSAKSFIAAEGFLFLRGYDSAKRQLEKAEAAYLMKGTPRLARKVKFWQENLEEFNKRECLYTPVPEYKQISDAVKNLRAEKGLEQ